MRRGLEAKVLPVCTTVGTFGPGVLTSHPRRHGTAPEEAPWARRSGWADDEGSGSRVKRLPDPPSSSRAHSGDGHACQWHLGLGLLHGGGHLAADDGHWPGGGGDGGAGGAREHGGGS